MDHIWSLQSIHHHLGLITGSISDRAKKTCFKKCHNIPYKNIIKTWKLNEVPGVTGTSTTPLQTSTSIFFAFQNTGSSFSGHSSCDFLSKIFKPAWAKTWHKAASERHRELSRWSTHLRSYSKTSRGVCAMPMAFISIVQPKKIEIKVSKGCAIHKSRHPADVFSKQFSLTINKPFGRKAR